MKTVKQLTIGERLAAINLLNAGKFNNSTLAVVLEDIRKFSMTEEDWTAANLVKTPTDEEVAALSPEERKVSSQTWKWDETLFKDVELEQGTVDALKSAIQERSDSNSLTLQDGPLLSLQKKLNE